MATPATPPAGDEPPPRPRTLTREQVGKSGSSIRASSSRSSAGRRTTQSTPRRSSMPRRDQGCASPTDRSSESFGQMTARAQTALLLPCFSPAAIVGRWTAHCGHLAGRDRRVAAGIAAFHHHCSDAGERGASGRPLRFHVSTSCTSRSVAAVGTRADRRWRPRSFGGVDPGGGHVRLLRQTLTCTRAQSRGIRSPERAPRPAVL